MNENAYFLAIGGSTGTSESADLAHGPAGVKGKDQGFPGHGSESGES